MILLNLFLQVLNDITLRTENFILSLPKSNMCYYYLVSANPLQPLNLCSLSRYHIVTCLHSHVSVPQGGDGTHVASSSLPYGIASMSRCPSALRITC